MPLLLAFLFLALGVSFICSIIESVLLTATPSYIDTLKGKSPRRAALLASYKNNIDRPLAAILSLNTVAHTVGAAGVGAEAVHLFGETYVALISTILTLLILVFSEIIPKTIGARYWQPLLLPLADPLRFLIIIAYPLVLLSRGITRIISGTDGGHTRVSREEIGAMATAGLRDGVLHRNESSIVRNLLRSGGTDLHDFMTPRTVMFSLPAGSTLQAVRKEFPQLPFSRIPVWKNDVEDIDHYVLRSDLQSYPGDPGTTTVEALQRPLLTVPENAKLLTLFDTLLERRENIALVVDEHGSVAGVVSMEDILETLLGIEIVDEDDETADLQQFARQKGKKRIHSSRT